MQKKNWNPRTFASYTWIYRFFEPRGPPEKFYKAKYFFFEKKKYSTNIGEQLCQKTKKTYLLTFWDNEGHKFWPNFGILGPKEASGRSGNLKKGLAMPKKNLFWYLTCLSTPSGSETMRHWVLTPFWVIFDEFWRTHLKKGPKTPFRPPEWLQRRHNRGMASLFLRFPDPTGASLGPKIPKLGSPIISELKPVGFFCLLTKLFTYVSTTFVFYKKKLLCKIE